MGNRRLKGQQFLREHPICCFCGGKTPSTEPDHVPGRAFFVDRRWPEGFEFPACVNCNRATRHVEQVVALLSYIYSKAKTEKEREAASKRMREADNNNPGLLEEMKPSIRQLRTARQKYGLTSPEGTAANALPALSVSGPIVSNAMTEFSRKLFCALHYKHSAEILSGSGGIAMRWFSNLQISAGEIDRQLATLTPNIPKFERDKVTLSDQFFYRYGASESKRLRVFLAFFRESFAILGVVNLDAGDFAPKEERGIIRPYDWRLPENADSP